MTFESIVNEMLAIYKKKNSDYGNSFELMYQEYGDVYPIMHLQEKLNRIKKLALAKRHKQLVDSILDLANYAVLYLMEQTKGGEE